MGIKDVANMGAAMAPAMRNEGQKLFRIKISFENLMLSLGNSS